MSAFSDHQRPRADADIGTRTVVALTRRSQLEEACELLEEAEDSLMFAIEERRQNLQMSAAAHESLDEGSVIVALFGGRQARYREIVHGGGLLAEHRSAQAVLDGLSKVIQLESLVRQSLASAGELRPQVATEIAGEVAEES